MNFFRGSPAPKKDRRPTEPQLREFLSRMELLVEPQLICHRRPGMLFEQALDEAESRGCRLVSSRFAFDVLYMKNGWKDHPFSWPIWTGTVVAFPAKGARFGDSVDWLDRGVRYHIGTKSFRGLKDAALVLESGTYALVRDGSTAIFLPTKAPVIACNFPQSSGWFGFEELTGLPAANGQETVRFSRPDEARVLPVAADYYFVIEGKRQGHAMSLLMQPSRRLGAIATPLNEYNYPCMVSGRLGSDERAEFLALVSEWAEKDGTLSRAVLEKFILLSGHRSFFQASPGMAALLDIVTAPR